MQEKDVLCYLVFGSSFSLYFNKTLVEIFLKLYFVLLRITLSDCISISSISVIHQKEWSLVLSFIGSCHSDDVAWIVLIFVA